jgi:leucyl aminopeptidase (aminopeptidase T)
MDNKISDTVEILVNKIAKINSSEKVLIITDKTTEFLIHPLIKGLSLVDKKLLLLSANENVPENYIIANDVFFVFTKENKCFSSSINRAVEIGKKVICCANCTLEKFLKSIPEDIDKYHEMTLNLVSTLTKNSSFEIISGNKLHLKGNIDNFYPRYVGFKIDEMNNFAILPGGIIGVSIIPDSVNGDLLINGFIQGIGLTVSPIKMKIEKGNVISVDGSEIPLSFVNNINSSWFRPCELGIGVNPNSKTSEDIHESESELGIIDIGFGENMHIGGPIQGNNHFDVTSRNSTLYVNKKLIVKNGEIYI